MQVSIEGKCAKLKFDMELYFEKSKINTNILDFSLMNLEIYAIILQ